MSKGEGREMVRREREMRYFDRERERERARERETKKRKGGRVRKRGKKCSRRERLGKNNGKDVTPKHTQDPKPLPPPPPPITTVHRRPPPAAAAH